MFSHLFGGYNVGVTEVENGRVIIGLCVGYEGGDTERLASKLDLIINSFYMCIEMLCCTCCTLQEYTITMCQLKTYF